MRGEYIRKPENTLSQAYKALAAAVFISRITRLLKLTITPGCQGYEGHWP